MMAGLANHLWQSTVVACLAWLVTIALRRDRAGVRYGVWLAASLKFLIPFSMFTALGERFGVRPVVVVDGKYHSGMSAPKVAEVLDSAVNNNKGARPGEDLRMFPLHLACPSCNHSLLDRANMVDGYPSIHVTVSFGGSEAGWDEALRAATGTAGACPCRSGARGWCRPPIRSPPAAGARRKSDPARESLGGQRATCPLRSPGTRACSRRPR